jgi:hypothetical protein
MIIAAGVLLAPVPAPAAPHQTLPPRARFLVLSNMNGDAVLDRETGLVWEQAPYGGLHDAYNAHRRCNNLRLGNRKGWRVPTVQELASLVDGDEANTSYPRLPPGHPFTNVQPGLYRSATHFPNGAEDPGNVWVVNFSFNDGVVGTQPKYVHMFVWCVRGGQGVDTQY